MALLDPDEIKDEKKQRELSSQRRIATLNAAEADANRRVNDALAREKEQKERIQAEAEQGIPVLEAKKAKLQADVEALEVRKTEALRPVAKVLAETKRKLEENNKQGELIAKKSAQLDREQETLLERIEAVKEQEQENATAKTKLDRRTKGVTESEAEVKRSTLELADKWVNYHKTVLDKETELKTREQRVASEAKANDIFATELKKVEEQQAAEVRAIADKYATLERAIAEFERKQHG